MIYSIINTNIFSKGFSTIEIIMNISFILIILLIIYILYWHNINRKIAKLNRCKINLNSQGSIYTVYGKYNNTKLYKIKYDNTENHNVSVDCVCPPGNIPNKFNIKAFNTRTNKTQNADKYCNCDKYYNANEKDMKYSGDDFLIDYHTNKKNKLNFPDVI